MKIKESIYDAVNTMNLNELIFLYEQIRFFEKKKNVSTKKKPRFSIEDILEMTSSSESRWADAVIEERAERI